MNLCTLEDFNINLSLFPGESQFSDLNAKNSVVLNVSVPRSLSDWDLIASPIRQSK